MASSANRDVLKRASEVAAKADSVLDQQSSLVCPLTGQLPSQPVVASDGQTYDRAALLKLFESQVRTLVRDNGRQCVLVRREKKMKKRNEPVWPTWAIGALFRIARCIHISHVCFHIHPSLRSRDILVN